MPGRNVIKQYIKDGYYHLYNRGVEKRVIFLDDQDYRVFLSLLKSYLTKNDDEIEAPDHRRKELSTEIDLICYCLMPNHFHLLVRQQTERGITNLMRCLNTSYTMYFNHRYSRVGTLFQGIYKATRIDRDEYLVHLSRYIHLNPAEFADPQKYPFSSFSHFISAKTAKWLKPNAVLDLYKDKQEYREFVLSQLATKIELGRLTLETD